MLFYLLFIGTPAAAVLLAFLITRGRNSETGYINNNFETAADQSAITVQQYGDELFMWDEESKEIITHL